MKKSKVISLVLVSASLAGCHTIKPSLWDNSHDAVYWDSPVALTTAAVQDSSHSTNGSHLWLWHQAFRSYRCYRPRRGAIHGTAHGVVAVRTVRGGFGKGFTVAS